MRRSGVSGVESGGECGAGVLEGEVAKRERRVCVEWRVSGEVCAGGV